MRKLIFSLLALAAMTATAQTYLPEGARSLVTGDRHMSAACYVSYDNAYPHYDHSLTPAPAGYEAFYISTYNRHGSRWLISPNDYDKPIRFLETQLEVGGLTKKGKKLLSQLKELRRLSPNEKLGVLTDVGFVQHNGVATRMCKNYPEIFDKKAEISARSSMVPRCVKSMAEEAEVIERMSGSWVSQESGRPNWQNYLAYYPSPKEVRDAHKGCIPAEEAVAAKHVHPERLLKTLLKKPALADGGEAGDFMRYLFQLAGNMQSHHFNIDLFPYFTDDEVYDLFLTENVSWYFEYAETELTGGLAPWQQKWLLRDFVLAADTLVNRKDFHGATLRFGHDSCVLPLVALMNLGTVNTPVADLDTLDRVFREMEIVPMAGNVQVVFYRPTSGEGDILVKAVLNEREMTMPLQAVSGPYYRWADVRDYWVARVNKHQFSNEPFPVLK